MYIDNKLVGKYVSLRSVEVSDAEYILGVRNDPRISKYLPPLNVTVEQQRQWISKQRADKESYYFLMETPEDGPIGSISVYDINCYTAETGRFCSFGGPAPNIETCILLHDFCFDFLKLKSIHIWVYEENKPVLRLNEGLGYKWIDTKTAEDGRKCRIGQMTLSDYLEKKKKLTKILHI